ncbi:hypothetical protein HOC01_01035 [archaeon]|nr:hypothetical protein [archaeon]MBT6698573.1 hypothetical protein [archaeon]
MGRGKLKLFILCIMFVSVLFLVSCSDDTVLEWDESGSEESALDVEASESDGVEEELVVEIEEVVEEIDLSCSDSSECAWNEHCIESVCGTVATIYDTEGECETKCNFNEVEISTSDGEELTLSRGTGSYTSAGALEWKLLSSADYCLGDTATPVAIELIKKNTGEILEEEVIVLDLGERSEIITHPTISRVSFTLTVDDYVESCE